jgi:two-component system cell cycle response regulator
MSSSDERAKLVQSLENGADDFISKPPASEELQARLRAAERLTTMQAELIRLAMTDSLTGLLTRRAFFDIATKLWKSAGAERPISALVCDLDKFKRINDTYGHDVGDLVLRSVSSETSLIGAPVGRLGGEEFACLLEVRLDDALEIANRFRNAIGELAISAGNNTIGITCSIGVAEWEPGDSIDKLLRRADVSLYEAKRSGRNRVIAADTFPTSKDHEQWRGVARLSQR